MLAKWTKPKELKKSLKSLRDYKKWEREQKKAGKEIKTPVIPKLKKNSGKSAIKRYEWKTRRYWEKIDRKIQWSDAEIYMNERPLQPPHKPQTCAGTNARYEAQLEKYNRKMEARGF